jgi:two-component system, chemotaxis family, chemotaxis protein CheY
LGARNKKRQFLLYAAESLDDRSGTFGKKSTSSARAAEDSPERGLYAHKKTVAIVDDDILVRSIFERILKINGYVVLGSMSDGQELVDSIEKMQPRPEVILLDERMPKMSGIEACKIVHAKYPSIEIIFVSADDSAKQRAMQAGAKAFIAKPITARELVKALT